MSSSNNSFMDRRQMNRHYYAKQIDSSELIQEIQLSLMYLIRMIFSAIQSSIKHFVKRIIHRLNELYINSALNILVFKLRTYSLIRQSRQNGLMEWLQKQLSSPSFKPNNFNDDWRDGIRLCALCETIRPGSCPRFDLLNPNNYVNNLKLAFYLIRNNLNIQTDLNVNEIYECHNEAKIIHLLSQMKKVHTESMLLKSDPIRTRHSKQWINQIISKIKYLESHDQFLNDYKIKGMGITLGVRSRRTRFSIYYASYPREFSFIIEILGPIGSFCSEKIEIDNSKRLQNVVRSSFYRDEMTQNLTMKAAMKIKYNRMNLKIPFFFELMDDHILITYIPLYAGEHQISIIWQGQHIVGSPYYAMIEETEYLQQESNEIGPKFIPGMQYPLCLLRTDQEYGLDEIGTVIRKKTIRKSIIIKGKEYDYYNYLERLQKSRQFEYPFTNVQDILKEIKISNDHNKKPMSISDSSRTSSVDSECLTPKYSPIQHQLSLPEESLDDNVNPLSKDELLENVETKSITPRIKSRLFSMKRLRSHKSLNENNNDSNEIGKKLKKKVKNDSLAVILCGILSGQIKLEVNDFKGAKEIIESIDQKIDNEYGITTVHARFFQLASDYYQKIGDHAEYYRNALRYLGCCSTAGIEIQESDEVLAQRAFTLSLAAILGQDIFNFGELLLHPILKKLKPEHEYMRELLFAFNFGNMAKFNELKPKWQTQPDLVVHEADMRKKICLLCLMEMAFASPNAVLTFEKIATSTDCLKNDVELMVMKALSKGLIKGHIDEVEQKVTISWVQPRVLNKDQIRGMRDRLDKWIKDINDFSRILENKAQDIMA
ncbi:regulatory particle non-ATPase 9 [Dermatophagoides pteronyssinus]|uniref:regulatory particle non-ATPase 9 n=1 Tax=Dermatophagoides pteronyssinus TaxID=6956 RepID=UPI003F67203B